MITESPLVATDMEYKVAVDSGAVVIAKEEGEVTAVDGLGITVGKTTYRLRKFQRPMPIPA